MLSSRETTRRFSGGAGRARSQRNDSDRPTSSCGTPSTVRSATNSPATYPRHHAISHSSQESPVCGAPQLEQKRAWAGNSARHFLHSCISRSRRGGMFRVAILRSEVPRRREFTSIPSLPTARATSPKRWIVWRNMRVTKPSLAPVQRDATRSDNAGDDDGLLREDSDCLQGEAVDGWSRRRLSSESRGRRRIVRAAGGSILRADRTTDWKLRRGSIVAQTGG